MLKNLAVALTALVVLGFPSMARAEDSSSSFDGRLRAMTARAWGGYGGDFGGVFWHKSPFWAHQGGGVCHRFWFRAQPGPPPRGGGRPGFSKRVGGAQP